MNDIPDKHPTKGLPYVPKGGQILWMGMKWNKWPQKSGYQQKPCWPQTWYLSNVKCHRFRSMCKHEEDHSQKGWYQQIITVLSLSWFNPWQRFPTCRHEEDSKNLTGNLSKSDVVRFLNHLKMVRCKYPNKCHNENPLKRWSQLTTQVQMLNLEHALLVIVHLHKEEHIREVEDSGKPHESERHLSWLWRLQN